MRRGWTLIENLVVISILLILVAMLSPLVGGCCGGIYPDYSDGTRAGEILKASKKGLLWKSWEVQMKTSDFGLRAQTTDKSWSNLFECSTRDDSIGEELESLTGKTVKVKYRQWLIRPWQQSTDYTIVSVEALDEKD